METNYYQSELKKLVENQTTEMPFNVKLTNGENVQTKWMQLNDESAKELIIWLQNNYPNCMDKKD